MPQNPEKGPGAFDLLSRFTQLRQSGHNRDDAWYRVCDAEPDMTEVTCKAFLALAKDWERREGHKYRYRDATAHATLSSKDIAAVVQSSHQPQQSDNRPKPEAQAAHVRKAALTGQLNPGALSAYNQQRLDQILDQLEDDATDAQPTNKPPQPVRERPRREPSRSNSHDTTAPMRHADGFFGPNTILLAYFKHFPHPLRVNIAGDDELFIGRKTANSAMAPDIDLNPVNADDYGISRMHAVITRRDNKLLIADLESLNYTYVNGMRLLPEEYYILKDGDEIWFAQLHCRIRFQHK